MADLTTEMLEAGASAVWATPGTGASAGDFDVEDLVSRVYRAMRAVADRDQDARRGEELAQMDRMGWIREVGSLPDA